MLFRTMKPTAAWVLWWRNLSIRYACAEYSALGNRKGSVSSLLSCQLYHRLQPGEAMTFNNRRMAHSRTGFKLNGGVRHLQVRVKNTLLTSETKILCIQLRGWKATCQLDALVILRVEASSLEHLLEMLASCLSCTLRIFCFIKSERCLFLPYFCY